ncbi:MAG: sulfotransferase family protein [Thermoanaerobaculia bacterium]
MSLRDLYRRLRYGEPIVVVSGLPRSGTSMAMKMLQAGGLPLVTDGERKADEDNPKGYFEYEPVMNLARDPDKSWLAGARGKGVKIISTLLRELPAGYNYRVVFMRRDLSEILASQAKMLQRRGEESGADDEQMRLVFENDLWRANYLLKNGPQFSVLPVHYTEVLAEPMAQARRLAGFLGGDLDVDKMAAVADPELYRNRAEGGSA